MKAISATVKASIVSLLKRGLSISEISVTVGVSNATVCRIRKKISRELRFKNVPGRSRKLSFREERTLVMNVCSGEWPSASKSIFFPQE